MKARNYFKSSIIVLFFLCTSVFVQAQPGGGGPDPDPGSGAPLDLGISVLVAAGIGYAAKKKYDSRKKERIESNIEK